MTSYLMSEVYELNPRVVKKNLFDEWAQTVAEQEEK